MTDTAGTSGEVARYYEEYWSQGGFAPERPLSAPFRELLERWTRAEDDCIDIGCGTGEGVGEWLSAHANSYLGVDISQPAVELATARGLNARRVPDASDLGCPPRSFDFAVCFDVLEHLFSPQLVAAEVLRVLRPGGRLLIAVPNVAHWRRRLDLAVLGRWKPLGDDQSSLRPWRDPHIRFFAKRNLEPMLEESGFADVEVGGLSGAFLSDLPVLRRLLRRDDVAGPISGRLVHAYPSLFGRSLFAIGTKPADIG